jgi:hypothetical protein
MQFQPSRPDVVRAVNQRWLLKFWAENVADGRVPRWQRIDAQRLSTMQQNLSLLDVVTRACDGALRFLIRYHGQTIQRAYGSPDARGRYLDEIVSPGTCPTGLAPYEKAVRDGQPVYTIVDVTDRQGRLVHAERLLLPFARDGETVDRVLAAFEFFCADGAFDAELLMQLSEEPALRLSALIEARA